MSRRSDQLGLFAAFQTAGVEYAVVGGVAVNAYGFARMTRDLDIFFRPNEENAAALLNALLQLGAPFQNLQPSDLLLDEEHVQLQTPYGPIELLTFIGEISFDQVWRNRTSRELEGVLVHFISKQDLIENKSQVGRSIDLVDVEELRRLPDSLDPELGPEE